MWNNILTSLEAKIKNGEENSPFLFVGQNLELTNSKVNDIALKLLKDFDIPSSYLYTLEDSPDAIKIKEIKEFVEFSHSKPPYAFQIFFIQNISRFTLTSSNSLLKFLEEPGKQNIIFLTNTWENWVLDTILSRVQIINIWWDQKKQKDNFYAELLNNFVEKRNLELLDYFFRNKLEKEDYIKFLETLILYAKENLLFIDMLEEIDDDLNAIKQNNVNPKYMVDKWLLSISS